MKPGAVGQVGTGEDCRLKIVIASLRESDRLKGCRCRCSSHEIHRGQNLLMSKTGTMALWHHSTMSIVALDILYTYIHVTKQRQWILHRLGTGRESIKNWFSGSYWCCYSGLGRKFLLDHKNSESPVTVSLPDLASAYSVESKQCKNN